MGRTRSRDSPPGLPSACLDCKRQLQTGLIISRTALKTAIDWNKDDAAEVPRKAGAKE